MINDQNIQNLNENYRDIISICPQNGTLFNESIIYNLKYSNPDATDDQVYKICEELGIYDKIMSFEKGFNSSVGTLGNKLSGGEKQRVLLARSLLKKSSILILDEPTSNLDSNNEQKVMNLLDTIKYEKTIIICSHKLNTLNKCNTILVLNEGEIIEKGSHNDLISNENSHYYQLYKNNLDKKDL